MKANVITMAALVWAASAMAGEWQLPTVSNFQSIEDQTKGYLYNTKTGMFLINGNDYNTTASLGYEGLEVKFEDCTEAQGVNAWQIRFSINNGLLFIGYANGTYYDGELKSSNMGHNYWAITPTVDGAYRIAIASNDDKYAPLPEDEVEWFFGWWGKINADGSLSQTKCMYNVNPEDEGIGIDWKVVSVEDYTLYAARTALYNLLNEAEEAGVSTADAEAIYNNESATLEQIKAAVQKQSEILNNVALMGATDENPVDATFLIKDADCTSDKGWDCTTSYGLQGASYSNGEVAIAGFMERWVNAGSGANTLSASTMSQTLKSLPEGRYRLEADAIACNQGNNEPVTGVTVFASFDGETLSHNVNTGNGLPEHYAIDFVFDKVTDLTIGFDAAEGNTANWIAVDNFRLTYYGVSDNPYYFPLVESIAVLESYEADGDTYWYSAATQKAWEELLEHAIEAKEGEPEEMQAMTIEIDEFIKALKAEIAAYEQLQAMIEKVEEATMTFAEFPTLCDMLAELYEELSDAYDDATYGVEEIAALDEVYDNIINQGVRADLEPGMDLTVLIKNPNFDGDDNNGWEGTRPSTQHEVGEIWNAGLDMHQTIKNLPAGQYTLRVNAFYRNGTNAEHYADEQLNAVLYGNLQKVKIKSIFSGWMDESVSGSIAFELPDGTVKYIPNNRESFNQMQAGYPNELKIIVNGDGEDLTIGIKTIGTVPANSWTCFDNFTLTYDGVDADSYIARLTDAADALAASRDSKLATAPLTQDIDAVITTLNAEAYAMTTADGVDAIIAKIDAIAAMESQLEAVAAAVHDYKALTDYLATVCDEAFLDDEAFLASCASVNAVGTTPWADSDAMTAEMTAMRSAWAQHLLNKGNDMSLAIINPGFSVKDAEDNDIDSNYGWSNDGVTGTTRVSAHEFWNCNFNFYQTINGLPEGYYTLTVNGFYRAGWADDAAKLANNGEHPLNASLYATVGDETWTSQLMCVFNDAATESLVEADNKNNVNGVTLYTPNSMEHFALYEAQGRFVANAEAGINALELHVAAGQAVTLGVKKDALVAADWTIFDTFRLTYNGKTSTGIAATENAADVNAVEYYSVNGIRLAHPEKGVNIVRTVMSDGSIKTSKVLVK